MADLRVWCMPVGDRIRCWFREANPRYNRGSAYLSEVIMFRPLHVKMPYMSGKTGEPPNMVQ